MSGQFTRPLIGALIIACGVSVLLVFRSTGTGADTSMEMMKIENETLTRVCYPDFGLVADPDSLAVLVLHSFDPGPSGVSTIEVTPIATGTPAYIDVFPSGPFISASAAEAQRFFIPVSANECYDIRLVGDGQAQAEVSLELQTLNSE